MGALLVFAIVASIALLVVRVGAVALMKTGLSRDVASFQACSAFFGVGFTTSEAELVVTHPVRRRITRDLIIAGNIGLLSLASAVLVAFLSDGSGDGQGVSKLSKIAMLSGWLVLLWLLSRLPVVRWLVDAGIEWSLGRLGMERVVDYEDLLRLGAGYEVARIEVVEGHPFAGRRLADLALRQMRVIVLGVTRADGVYEGSPDGETRIEAGDAITVYADEESVREMTGE